MEQRLYIVPRRGHVCSNSTCTDFLRENQACAQYVKPARFRSGGERLTMQAWLRAEWQRSGLPLRRANDACGVLNAATRKYLTSDHMWYYPPPDAFTRLSAYANLHGRPEGRPYFSLDGTRSLSAAQWARMRAKFNCAVGITNVWTLPHVGGRDRVNGARERMRWKFKSLHGSQKPLELIEIPIRATTDAGDVVWEPFGGLCPVAICAWRLGRESYSAEIVREFYEAAASRLSRERARTD